MKGGMEGRQPVQSLPSSHRSQNKTSVTDTKETRRRRGTLRLGGGKVPLRCSAWQYFNARPLGAPGGVEEGSIVQDLLGIKRDGAADLWEKCYLGPVSFCWCCNTKGGHWEHLKDSSLTFSERCRWTRRVTNGRPRNTLCPAKKGKGGGNNSSRTCKSSAGLPDARRPPEGRRRRRPPVRKSGGRLDRSLSLGGSHLTAAATLGPGDEVPSPFP